MNFDDHQEAARQEFHEHCQHCQHMLEDDAYAYDRRQIDEAFYECVQIKEVEGMIKIKWEHACWWHGCVWNLYYCRLARDVQWVEPYDMAKQSSLNEYTRKS